MLRRSFLTRLRPRTRTAVLGARVNPLHGGKECGGFIQDLLQDTLKRAHSGQQLWPQESARQDQNLCFPLGKATLATPVKGRRAQNARVATGETSRFDVPRSALLRNVGLTMQESHSCARLIQGKRNSEIASILSSKTRTVQKPVQDIFNKVGG
jgi:DNA-binding CsgD family transcriptional regulator